MSKQSTSKDENILQREAKKYRIETKEHEVHIYSDITSMFTLFKYINKYRIYVDIMTGEELTPI